MRTEIAADFKAAKVHDYVVVPGHDGPRINRWTLGRVVDADDNGKILRAEHVDANGKATGVSLEGVYYVINARVKPKHVKMLVKTEWSNVIAAHDALSDAVLGPGWRTRR